MNLFDLRLISIRTIELKGQAFNISAEDNAGYAGRFQADILDDISGISVGDTLTAQLSFFARDEDEADPFFSITVSGVLEIVGEAAVPEITGVHGSFQVATFLFPYLRNTAKPLLEQLGATDVDFPLHLPPPPNVAPEKSKRRKTKQVTPRT